MSTKEKIKQALDTLSDKDLEKIEQLIDALKSKKRTDGLPTFNLGGKFDKMDIRRAAYE